ncbi:MAG TPA: hypothetical protein PLV45_18015, partial [bacterium]|nr:hypothetical protein [bacterium]
MKIQSIQTPRSTIEKSFSSIIRALISLGILAVLAGACGRGPAVPAELRTQIDLPVDPSRPEAGTFLPVDTPFRVMIEIDTTERLPDDTHLALRVIDHRDREYHRQSWPLHNLDPGSSSLVRLFRITNLPGSRKVRVQVALTGEGGAPYRTGTTDPAPWHTMTEGYALHRSMVFTGGWYTREASDEAVSPVSRWCNGHGVVYFSRPLFPMILRIDGYSLPQCFPDGQWDLAVTLNGVKFYDQIIREKHFRTAYVIPDVRDCRSVFASDREWPVGEVELVFESDRVFTPLECSGHDDTRELAFHLDRLEFDNLVPESGFYGPREPDGLFWPAPDCAVRVALPADTTDLYIQGIRATDC